MELSKKERNILSSKQFKKGSKFNAMLNKRIIKGEEFVSAATSRDMGEVFGRFANTSYGEVLNQAGERFSGTEVVPAVERIMEQYMIQRGAAMFGKNPLSIASVIGYLWLKLCETVNLRIICRGKVAHMPEPLIREELIFV